MRRSWIEGWSVGVLSLCFAVIAAGQVATISPAKPGAGSVVTLAYDPSAAGATLKDSVSGEALFIRGEALPLLVEVPMKTEGGAWKGTFTISDPDARLVLLRFVSGESFDDNNGNPWRFFIYGPDGMPAKGAHAALGSMYMGFSLPDFRVAKDLEAAKAEWRAELSRDPGTINATTALWTIDMSQNRNPETTEHIKVQLDSVYGANKSDESAVARLLSFFDRTGQAQKASEIRASALATDPTGKLAESIRANEVHMARDAAARGALIEKFLADFPASENAKNFQALLLMSYGQSDQPEKALKAEEAMAHPDPMALNSISWAWAEKGEHLTEAAALAKRAVDVLRTSDPASRPPYMSQARWKESQEDGLGMVLDTYGYALMLQKKYGDAEPIAAEAFRISKGSDADVTERYVDCLLEDGKYEKAMEVSADAVRRNQSNDKLTADYRSAYTHVKGSDAGFDDTMAKAHSESLAELRSKLIGERMNAAAIDFTLKGMDGDTVSLSSLKGKVVIVDFWATWCGPCRASFPFLQQVYDSYKKNGTVVFLALDTWERVQGAERESTVKKFIADNKYTFPVLYDEDYVTKYGVDGIPTKFLIDKNGKIQFKSVGFENGPKMVDELTTEIDLLLSDDFYKSVD